MTDHVRLSVNLAPDVAGTLKSRGDLDERTVAACAAHVRGLLIDYKIKRDGGYDHDEAGA